MGKNLHEKNIADAMNKYFQISQRTVNSASIAIPSVIPAIQRSLEMTERISKVIAPTIQMANLYSKALPITSERLHSILNGLPSTERFVSLLGGEAFPEYSDDLINAVILETEEYYQGLPDIEEYGYDSETQEAENLIEEVFNDIQNVTPFDVNKSYVCEIPDPVLKIAGTILFYALVSKIYQFCTGQVEYDAMLIGVRIVLAAFDSITN